MRFLLSAALLAAFCLPAMAQPGGRGPGPGDRGFPGRPGGEPPANKEVDALKETIKALEAKLRAVTEGKKESKVEVVVVKEDKKPEKKDERRPEPKKPEGGDRRPEGPGNPPMGGRGFGGPGGPGFGGPMGGRGFGGFARGSGEFTPPGFDKLSKDEQEMFRKLMAKMMGGERRPDGDRRPEGGPRPTLERRPEGGDRKPNVEERLERLERAIEEIRRGLQGQRGERR